MPPGGFDMSQLGQMLTQLGQMLSQAQNTGGGPVNYDLAANIAKQRLAGTTSSLTDAQRRPCATPCGSRSCGWTRPPRSRRGRRRSRPGRRASGYASLPTWKRLCDPVAQRVSVACGGPARGGPRRRGPDAGDARSDGRPRVRQPARRRPGPARCRGAELHGRRRARRPAGTAALLPENIEKFTAGLDRPASEVMIYLAAREAAHQRLFAHVGWLRERLLGTVEEYARGITVDTSRIEDRWPAASTRRTPARSRRRMRCGDVRAADHPGTAGGARRLETLLALIEGWVDAVVADAVGDRLPGAGGAARDAAPAARRGGTRRADVRDDRRAGTAAAAAAQRRRAVAAPRRAARDRGARRAVGTPGPDPVCGRPRGPGCLRRSRGARRPDRRAGEGDAGRGAGREGPGRQTTARSPAPRRPPDPALTSGASVGPIRRRRRSSVRRRRRPCRPGPARPRRTAPPGSPSPARCGVAAHPGPERLVVARFEQVRELVDEHVVHDPARGVAQTLADPDRAVRRGAGRPAGAHRRHPPHRRGLGAALQVPARELDAAPTECVVAGAGGRAASRLAAFEAAHHLVHPARLLRLAHPAGDEDDHRVALTPGAHHPAAAFATTDLHDRGPDHRPRLSSADPAPERSAPTVPELSTTRVRLWTAGCVGARGAGTLPT